MIAIIAARGGSKTLPHKNTKLLNGKPLICHIFETALKSAKIDKIILSTDSKDIAKLAQPYQIEVPFMRPRELATDESLVIDTYIYTIDRLIKDHGYDIESFVSLQATSPLTSHHDINNAVDHYNQEKVDSLVSVCECSFPMEWAFKLSKQGFLSSVLTNGAAMKNRQAYEKIFIPNGSIHIFNYRFLKLNRTYYTEHTCGFVMPPERSVDIDTEFDFNLAEFLLKKRKSNEEIIEKSSFQNT